MSEATQTALIVGFFGLMGSLGLALITGILLQRRDRTQAEIATEAKEADWARQDKVAADVLKAARTVAEEAKSASEAALAAAATNKVQLDAIDATTQDIHSWVNSDMTAARASELAAMHALLASLQTNLSHGADVEESIRSAEVRIGQLEVILADRAVQQDKVDAAGVERVEAGAMTSATLQSGERIDVTVVPPEPA